MQNQIIDWIKEDIKEIKDEMHEINEKINRLLEFKWKIVGGTIVASLVLTTLFQIILAIMQKSNS